MYWKKLTQIEIKKRVLSALNENVDYKKRLAIGVPATHLDNEIFYEGAPFLEDAPFIQTLMANPNHIGCHTLKENESLPYFHGTQELEKEVLQICAEQIFQAEPLSYDGYVTQGGTEANIQALWIYRNYYMQEHHAQTHEIALVYSEDSHYSIPKGGNLLNIPSVVLKVNEKSREIDMDDLDKKIKQAGENGIKYFIIVQNMATTMFGSIDDVNKTAEYFEENNLPYKLHIDAAFGGFLTPFAIEREKYSFKNLRISSFTLDGHKMLQTPYGTGIFLIRKGYMQYAKTEEAKYINGGDFTLSGSRSGAIAVAIWMTLMIHGSNGFQRIVEQLLDRTSFLCDKLDQFEVEYYRHPDVNIVTMRADYVPKELALKYGLVANDTSGKVKWWKIVVMHHVTQGIIDSFLLELRNHLKEIEATH